jgi:hypothetical protein
MNLHRASEDKIRTARIRYPIEPKNPPKAFQAASQRADTQKCWILQSKRSTQTRFASQENLGIRDYSTKDAEKQRDGELYQDGPKHILPRSP